MDRENRPSPDRLVLTIHGIRTYGQWQERLENLLRPDRPHILVEHYVYGYFSVIAFLIPPLRWLVVRRFRRALLVLASVHETRDILVVAHSFGTHLIGWALLGVPEQRRPKIHTIVLAGSVLKSAFPWRDLISAGTVGRVVNDCGIDDRVLALNQLVVLGTGMAGRFGFIGVHDDSLVDRFFQGGHSLYFERERRPDDDFMRRRWLPILSAARAVERVDERRAPSALGGMWVTILRNAEPIKLTAYATLLLTPTIVFALMWRGELIAEQKASQELRARMTSDSIAAAARGFAADATTREMAARESTAVARAEQRAADADKADALDLVNDLRVHLPFNDARPDSFSQDLVLGLLRLIQRAGYRGRIRLVAGVGQFCIAGPESDPSLPADSLPVSACTGLGPSSKEYAQLLGQRLSSEIKRLAVTNAIFPADNLEAVSSGVERPLEPYPRMTTHGLRVGEWNSIAHMNNYVEIQLLSPANP